MPSATRVSIDLFNADTQTEQVYILPMNFLTNLIVISYQNQYLAKVKNKGRDHGLEWQELILSNGNVFEYLTFKEQKQSFNIEASRLHANALNPHRITMIMDGLTALSESEHFEDQTNQTPKTQLAKLKDTYSVVHSESRVQSSRDRGS